MSDLVFYTAKVDEKTSITRGLNPNLITHMETLPQGGAIVFFMGGTSLTLNQADWAAVGKSLAGGTVEPSAGQQPPSQS